MSRNPNPVMGRVILEVTRHHAVLYLCDRKGIVTDNEVFRYPAALERDECGSECRAFFNLAYDWCNSVVNSELQGDGGEAGQSS